MNVQEDPTGGALVIESYRFRAAEPSDVFKTIAQPAFIARSAPSLPIIARSIPSLLITVLFPLPPSSSSVPAPSLLRSPSLPPSLPPSCSNRLLITLPSTSVK